MKVSLPKRPKRPRNIHPELLTEPSIPRPLHGVNPRTIRGKAWWDRERKKAYEYNNNYCHACGVYKRDAAIFQWLEAHEIYSIDYKKYRTKFVGVVALCHCCHAIIHAGRTTNVYLDGTIPRSRFDTIVKHGITHFKMYGLDYTVQLRFMELIHQKYTIENAKKILKHEFPAERPMKLSSWPLWRLEFNGRLYAPVFKSPEDWADRYGN